MFYPFMWQGAWFVALRTLPQRAWGAFYTILCKSQCITIPKNLVTSMDSRYLYKILMDLAPMCLPICNQQGSPQNHQIQAITKTQVGSRLPSFGCSEFSVQACRCIRTARKEESCEHLAALPRLKHCTVKHLKIVVLMFVENAKSRRPKHTKTRHLNLYTWFQQTQDEILAQLNNSHLQHPIPANSDPCFVVAFGDSSFVAIDGKWCYP